MSAFPTSDLDLTSTAFLSDPYPAYRALQQIGPIHYLEKHQQYFVVSYAACKEVLANTEDFHSSINASFDPVLLGGDGKVHLSRRKALEGIGRPFNKIRIDEWESRIRKICHDLLGVIDERTHFDFLADYAAPLPSLVILDVLGVYEHLGSMLRNWTDVAVSNSSIHNMEYSVLHWDRLKPILAQFIEDCYQEPRDGAISELIHHPKEEYVFNKEELIQLTKILLVGGNETTPNLMGNFLYDIQCNEALGEQMKTHPTLMMTALRECMRRVSPTQIVHRVAARDTPVEGYVIPKGSNLAVCLGAAHRDEAVFEQPSHFDMERDLKKIIPFGWGPHHCIGSRLALLEARIGMEIFLEKYPDIHLEQNSLEFRPSSHVRGFRQMDIRLGNTVTPRFSKEKSLENIILFLHRSQMDDGEFRSLEKYPEGFPFHENGWMYTSASPFIQGNILFSLLDVKHPLVDEIMQKGIMFLKAQLDNPYDLWRYWQHDSPNLNVPLDVDDTAIASFVLEKNGVRLKNKDILHLNLNDEHRILTWVIPNKKTWWKFRLNQFLKKDWEKVSAKVFELNMLEHNDTEPAVAANVLMYLGEQKKTDKIIKQFIQDIEKRKEMTLFFYDDILVVYYHIVRAAENGVPSFRKLYDIINTDVLGIISDTSLNIMKKSMVLYIMKHVSKNDGIIRKIELELLAEINDAEFQWKAYPYFCSKSRIFCGGSPGLTAAFALHALS